MFAAGQAPLPSTRLSGARGCRSIGCWARVLRRELRQARLGARLSAYPVRLAEAISRASDQGVHTTVHRETITDPAKVQEIEAALRNKQAASAFAEVVTGEHPEFGLVVLVKTGEGTVLLRDSGPRRS